MRERMAQTKVIPLNLQRAMHTKKSPRESEQQTYESLYMRQKFHTPGRGGLHGMSMDKGTSPFALIGTPADLMHTLNKTMRDSAR